jgi:maltose alpha-D-glucosyltransferase/alpha-amylase
VDEGQHSYREVNVASQLGDDASLLEAVRRLIQTRRESPEIGRGNWHVLEAESEAMLLYQCTWRDGLVVLTHNLSGTEHVEEIDLCDHRGETLEPLVSSQMTFERVDHKRYRVTLGPYGYAWFRMTEESDAEEKRHRA